jgi:hypothetical protein
VAAAVDGLNAAVHYAVDQPVPRGFIRKTKYPSWLSATFRYYIRKKNFFRKRFNEKNTDYFYNQFSKYCEFVKTTIKSDRLVWLKSIDDDLKTRLNKILEMCLQFERVILLRSSCMLMELAQMILVVLLKLLLSTFSQLTIILHHRLVLRVLFFSDFIPLFLISDRDIQKSIKRLRPTKSVGLGDIPRFIIKGSSDILVPVLKYVFNLMLSEKHFPSQWNQSVIVSVYKSGNEACVQNYRPVCLLKSFQKFLNLLYMTTFLLF